MQNNWLLEHETFGCVLTLEMFIRYFSYEIMLSSGFSYEIMLSSGLIKLFYNTVMPCAAVLLQPTNNYIFMLCKVNLYASDTSFETLNQFIPVSNCLDTFETLRYKQVVIIYLDVLSYVTTMNTKDLH